VNGGFGRNKVSAIPPGEQAHQPVRATHAQGQCWRILAILGWAVLVVGCDTIQDRNREAARRTSHENCIAHCERSSDVCGDSVSSALPNRDVNSPFAGGSSGYPVFGQAGSCRNRLDQCLQDCRKVR